MIIRLLICKKISFRFEKAPEFIGPQSFLGRWHIFRFSQLFKMLSLDCAQIIKKILIVEDDPDLIRAMLELRSQGYNTVLARNGKQALDIAVTQGPDLIMMDLKLPDMDGLEVARNIRQHPATCFIPILAVTARSLSDDRKRRLQDGCEDYIYKPISSPLLVSRIEKLLE